MGNATVTAAHPTPNQSLNGGNHDVPVRQLDIQPTVVTTKLPRDAEVHSADDDALQKRVLEQILVAETELSDGHATVAETMRARLNKCVADSATQAATIHALEQQVQSLTAVNRELQAANEKLRNELTHAYDSLEDYESRGSLLTQAVLGNETRARSRAAQLEHQVAKLQQQLRDVGLTAD